MSKFLPFLIIVSVLFSCRNQDDPSLDVQEPEYGILSLEDSRTITCAYTYPSIDENGEPITLSSALVAWKPTQKDSIRTIKTVLVGCHITITSDAECPTSIITSSHIGDATMFASLPSQAAIPELRRSIVIMPDYQGYGVSRDRIHPYLAQELTARQITDAVKYGLQLYKDLENAQQFADDWKTVCLGFSQGGAVALATQKYLELNGMDEELHYAGSFCADGPYDLNATLRFYFEDDGQSYGVTTQHRRATIPEPLVIPLMIKGMIDTDPALKGQSVDYYLSKQFIDTGIMEWISQKKMTTAQIRKAHYDMCDKGLTTKDSTYYTAEQIQTLFPIRNKIQSILGTDYEISADLTKILTPELLRYLDPTLQDPSEEIDDRISNLIAALSRNSLIEGWEVKHKIVFLHSEYDTTVPLVNYLTFSEHHPEAEIRFIPYGTEDHDMTGIYFFLSLPGTTFLEDFTWLFAEK